MNSQLRRLRAELFATPADAALSVVLITLLSLGAFGFLRWALTQAQWAVVQGEQHPVRRGPLPDRAAVAPLAAHRPAGGSQRRHLGPAARPPPPGSHRGAAGRSNDRLALGLLALIALAVPSALGLTLAIQARWWGLLLLLGLCRWLAGRYGTRLSPTGRRLAALVWPLLYLVGMVLISGGLGLVTVSPSEWGGLLLTLLASSFAILLCFPIGVLLALGRRSDAAPAALGFGALHRVHPRRAADHPAVPRPEHPRLPAARRAGPRAGLAGGLGAHLLRRRLSGGGGALRPGGGAAGPAGGRPLPRPLLSEGPAACGAAPGPAGGPAGDGGPVHLAAAGHDLAVTDWIAGTARHGPHRDGQPGVPGARTERCTSPWRCCSGVAVPPSGWAAGPWSAASIPTRCPAPPEQRSSIPSSPAPIPRPAP